MLKSTIEKFEKTNLVKLYKEGKSSPYYILLTRLD